VIIGLIVVMLAGVFLQGQGALEIRAASATAVSGWQQLGAPGGGPIWGGAGKRPDSRGHRTRGAARGTPTAARR
jgi:hypothetical protein